MTDYEILYEVFSDCFWAGVFAGKTYYDHGTAEGQACITIPAKITELLGQLGLKIEGGRLEGGDPEKEAGGR